MGQAIGPYSKTFVSTTGRKHDRDAPTFLAPVMRSGATMPSARKIAAPRESRAAQGLHTGLPSCISLESIHEPPSSAVCPALTGSGCLRNDLSRQTTHVQSDASTKLNANVTFSGGEIVPMSPSVNNSPLVLLRAELTGEEDEVQPASTRRRLSSDSQSSPRAIERPSRIPHSHIERRYRQNLNLQLDALTRKLPNLKTSGFDVDDSTLPIKAPTKALIIATAVVYIQKLESELAGTNNFVGALQEQIQGLQSLVRFQDCAT